jgi:membrane-bound lytic murein transglycosylase B
VTLNAAASAGVYLVSQDWSPEGAWVVSLSATCGSAKAGAIVPMGAQGFLRDGIKVLPRAAMKAEIDAALKALDKPAK